MSDNIIKVGEKYLFNHGNDTTEDRANGTIVTVDGIADDPITLFLSGGEPMYNVTTEFDTEGLAYAAELTPVSA